MFGKNNKQIQFFCTLFFDFHSWSMVLYLPSVMPKVWLSRLRMSCLCSNFSGLVELLEPLQHWLAHFEKYINYLIFGYGSMQPLKILWPPSVYSCRDGAVVRALASHQCGSGLIPRSGVKCGLSLLILFSAPRGFLRVLWFPLFSKTKIWLDCVNC